MHKEALVLKGLILGLDPRHCRRDRRGGGSSRSGDSFGEARSFRGEEGGARCAALSGGGVSQAGEGRGGVSRCAEDEDSEIQGRAQEISWLGFGLRRSLFEGYFSET